MIVTCENCDTNFNLDESLVKITGSKVRCSKCKHIFTTYPPKPSGEEPPTESDDLEPDMGVDLDTGTTEDSNFSDEQMLDETSSETDESDDLDLSDIEKMLDVEGDAEEEMSAEDDLASDVPGYDAIGDSLDLSDIEKILDDEALGDDLPEDKTDEDQDLIFDLDEALETEAEEDQLSPTSELDLGDLEKMFESEDEEPDLLLDDEPSLSDELESGDADSAALLSIEEDDVSEDQEGEMEEQSSAPESEESEESEETLDFDMEPVEEDEAPQLPSEEEDLVLDFDFEDADGDLPEDPDVKASDSDNDMDFELEMEEVDEGVVPEVGETDMPAEEEVEGVAPEIGETDMSVDDESSEVSDLGDALETEEISDDFLDSISEEEEENSEDGAADDEAPDEEPSDLDEEAEFDFPDDAVPDIPDEEDVLMDEEGSAQGEDFEGGEDVSGEISEPAEDKSDRRNFVAWLLIVSVVGIVIVLAALVFLQLRGFINVPYLDKVQLPFIGKLKAPEAPDLGSIVLDPKVENSVIADGKAGKLFIVTGKVKNDYNHPRSFIKVSCSLYTRGAILARTMTAYCGNVIPELELLKMEAPEIQARMENRTGELNSNVGIKPGEERPFMIVFFDYPESLEEFTVTVVSSSVAGE